MPDAFLGVNFMSDEQLLTSQQFKPGNRGRPVGSKNKSRQLIDALNARNPEALQAIVDKTLEAALAGKPWALTLLMDRLYPVPRGRLVEFSLPQLSTLADVKGALDATLQAVAGGQLSLEEGDAMCGMISEYAKPILDHLELQAQAVEDDA
jgi:hypothetical protein